MMSAPLNAFHQAVTVHRIGLVHRGGGSVTALWATWELLVGLGFDPH